MRSTDSRGEDRHTLAIFRSVANNESGSSLTCLKLPRKTKVFLASSRQPLRAQVIHSEARS